MQDSTRPCAHCGDTFKPRGRPYSHASTYCAPCGVSYRRAYNDGRVDEWHAERSATCLCGAPLATGYSKYCGDCKPPSRNPVRRQFSCAGTSCYNMCESSRYQAKYCSDACKQAAKKVKGRSNSAVRVPHWVASQPRLGPFLEEWPMFGPTKAPPLRVEPPSPRTNIRYAACDACDVLFVARCSTQRWCSMRCSRRIHNKKREAKKRNARSEPYTLRYIAERDGWRCHLCGGKVPDRRYAARDDDATVDHLIPVSHGGDDIRSNVALAHNRCNWERGNKGLAQLRLVG